MESEVNEREAARPSSVEDLAFANESATKDSSAEKKKVAGAVQQATAPESKGKCELQITEELEEFVEVSQKKNNDSGENPAQPVPKQTTKRIIVEAKPAPPKTTIVKKKLEPKTVGPLRDDDSPPWNGITLNRCLVVAAFLALLSVGFQVLQDVVDTDDELSEVDPGILPPDTTVEQMPEPWFFEGWFGTSQPTEPEEPDESELEELTEEEEELTEEEEELPEEEEELPIIEDQPEEAEVALDLTEPKSEEVEESHRKPKRAEQWGLKAKNKYMETKAIKIRKTSEPGSKRKDFFPFIKRPKESTKTSKEFKEKPYKEKGHKQTDKEKRFEHPKKQEGGKPYKKGKEEQNKYYKHEKGRKEEKEFKGFKQRHQEKEYRKQHNSRHHE
ncbi:junctional sarcoplasmic reticulum protein 1 [Pelodytes ibericus]